MEVYLYADISTDDKRKKAQRSNKLQRRAAEQAKKLAMSNRRDAVLKSVLK